MKKQITIAIIGIACFATQNVKGQILTPGGVIQGSSSNNHVGIGLPVSSVPTHKLVVNDNITYGGLMKLVNSNGQPNDTWWMGFCHGTNTSDNYDRARIGVDILAGGAGRLFFTTGLHNAQQERMRIDEDGKVGIGGSPYTDYVLNVENTVPGLPGGIRSFVFNTALSGIGIQTTAAYNGGSNTGIEAIAQAGTNSTAGKFEATQSDVVYGVDASASGTGNGNSTAYGGSFNASGGEEIYGVKARSFSTPGNKKNHAVYADAAGTYGQPDDNYGVYANAELTDGMRNYGVYAKAYNQYANGPQENYGVYAYAESNSSNTINIGVYAKIKGGKYAQPGPSQSYAGYFEGDRTHPNGPLSGMANAALFNGLTVTTAPGYYQLSDQKFKKNIEGVENAIEKIMSLSSKTYEFKGEEFPTFNFSAGKQYGFIAQDLEKVLPEMVHEFINPAQYDDAGNRKHDAVTFKSVNYSVLIPILTAGIQEQQTIIETQNAKITELEERLKKLEQNGTTGLSTGGNHSTVGAALFQNAPNPFGSNTEIRYRLPEKCNDAKIMVFDMNGKQVRTVALQGAGEGNTNFSSGDLAAGMYMYSLVIDGQEIDTKRMILSGK